MRCAGESHRVAHLAAPNMHVLFLCSRNRLRSPTAEQLFSVLAGVETDSAGLAIDADCQVDASQIDYADIIFTMEKQHKVQLTRRFKRHLKGKKVVCLDIPDKFEFMQPELIALLEKRVLPHLR